MALCGRLLICLNACRRLPPPLKNHFVGCGRRSCCSPVLALRADRRSNFVSAGMLQNPRADELFNSAFYRDVGNLRDGAHSGGYRHLLEYLRAGRDYPADSARRSWLYDRFNHFLSRLAAAHRASPADGSGAGSWHNLNERRCALCPQCDSRDLLCRRRRGADFVFPIPAGVRIWKSAVVWCVPFDFRILQRRL